MGMKKYIEEIRSLFQDRGFNPINVFDFTYEKGSVLSDASKGYHGAIPALISGGSDCCYVGIDEKGLTFIQFKAGFFKKTIDNGYDRIEWNKIVSFYGKDRWHQSHKKKAEIYQKMLNGVRRKKP